MSSKERLQLTAYCRLLPGAVTEEAGEVTPTLKIKRKVVAQRYADDIDSMYSRKKPA